MAQFLTLLNTARVPVGFQLGGFASGAVTLHTQASGLPFGSAFVGTAYTEFNLINHDLATHTRLKRNSHTQGAADTRDSPQT
jgi:amidase